jgi:ParB-like chromosome segregation protein Spo0J
MNKLIEKDVESLIPYAKNSRTHDDAQIAQLAASIKEFGFRNPILVDGNGVIAGHGRLLAARKLGLAKVPAIDCSDMSDAQKKAYVIADNSLALNAGWNFDFLKLEVEELQDVGFDTDLLGFDDSFMEQFMKEVEIVDMPDLNSGEKEPIQQMTFILHDSQVSAVEEAIAFAKANMDIKNELNSNTNGNAIALICEMFLTQNVS